MNEKWGRGSRYDKLSKNELIVVPDKLLGETDMFFPWKTIAPSRD